MDKGINIKAMFERRFIFFSSLIVVLLCSHNLVNAQTYLPFPDSNATWKWELGRGDIGCDITYTIIDSFGGDTTISGLKYNKLYSLRTTKCLAIPSGCFLGGHTVGYQGAIRTDTASGKVYAVPKGWLTDTLIYDYSLQTGDTLHTYLEKMKFTPITVDTVVFMQIGGIQRRYFLLSGGTDAIIIEGIGSTTGLLNSIDLWLDDTFSLICFAEEGIPVYQDWGCSSDADCDKLLAEDKPLELNNFTLYPNPGTNKIQLKGDFNFPLQLQMYSLNGQLLLSSEMKNVNESIDTSQLPRGMYFIKIEDREGKVGFGKWIRE